MCLTGLSKLLTLWHFRSRNYNSIYICGTDEYGTATEIKALNRVKKIQSHPERRYHATFIFANSINHS